MIRPENVPGSNGDDWDEPWALAGQAETNQQIKTE